MSGESVVTWVMYIQVWSAMLFKERKKIILRIRCVLVMYVDGWDQIFSAILEANVFNAVQKTLFGNCDLFRSE